MTEDRVLLKCLLTWWIFVFPKIKLAFSEDIGNKALLGMDILSLFSFMYNRKEGELCLMDCDIVNRYIERQ